MRNPAEYFDAFEYCTQQGLFLPQSVKIHDNSYGVSVDDLDFLCPGEYWVISGGTAKHTLTCTKSFRDATLTGYSGNWRGLKKSFFCVDNKV